jgi:hypothetical protein
MPTTKQLPEFKINTSLRKKKFLKAIQIVDTMHDPAKTYDIQTSLHATFSNFPTAAPSMALPRVDVKIVQANQASLRTMFTVVRLDFLFSMYLFRC